MDENYIGKLFLVYVDCFLLILANLSTWKISFASRKSSKELWEWINLYSECENCRVREEKIYWGKEERREN